MNDEVYAQFTAKGVTKEKAIITKRDASACLRAKQIENSQYCMFSSILFTDPNNYVIIK